MNSINNFSWINYPYPQDLSLTSFASFFIVFFFAERFACYNSYQCPVSEHKLEGVRFLSVGGFIIATGGAVGNRVDKFVAMKRTWLISNRYHTRKKNLFFCHLCHHERYCFNNCSSISFSS